MGRKWKEGLVRTSSLCRAGSVSGGRVGVSGVRWLISSRDIRW